MDKPTLLINSWLIKLLNKGIVSINVNYLLSDFFRYISVDYYGVFYSEFDSALQDLQFFESGNSNSALFAKRIMFEQVLCYIKSSFNDELLFNKEFDIKLIKEYLLIYKEKDENSKIYNIWQNNFQAIYDNTRSLFSFPVLSKELRNDFRQHLEGINFSDVASYYGISFYSGNDILAFDAHNNSLDFRDYLSLDFLSVVNTGSIYTTYFLVLDFFEGNSNSIKREGELYYYVEDRFSNNSALPIVFLKDPYFVLLRLMSTGIRYSSDFSGETIWLKPYPVDKNFLDDYDIMNFMLQYQPLYFFDMSLSLRKNRYLAELAYEVFFNFVIDEDLLGSWHGTGFTEHDFLREVE